jgi:hypothetical protein
VSQFVRLEQCERFLRFRLAERAGQKFMEEWTGERAGKQVEVWGGSAGTGNDDATHLVSATPEHAR